MANGNFLLDINNLMVETNGDFDNPSIESITEFDYFTDCIAEARIYFYENVNNGNRIQDSVEIVNDLCSKEVLHFYSKGSGQDYIGIGEQRRHFEQIGENSSRNQKRRGVLDKNRKFRNLHVIEEENVLEIECEDGVERIPLKYSVEKTDKTSENSIKLSRKSQEPTFKAVEAVRRENEVARLREFNEQYNADVKRTAEILDEIVKEASNRALPVTSREYGKDKAAGQAVAEAERDRLFEEQMQNYTYEYENEKKGHCHFKSRPCYERDS